MSPGNVTKNVLRNTSKDEFYNHVSFPSISVLSLLMMFFTPLVSFFLLNITNPTATFVPSYEVVAVYFCWLLYQLILYFILPGRIAYGQKTPAGLELKYKCNGHETFVVSLVTYTILVLTSSIDNSWIRNNWFALFTVSNVFAFFLTFFAYFKSLYFPTHSKDRKFRGSFFYDLLMGVEFNPRFGNFDFKLFFNGRPGIIGWVIINISFLFHDEMTLSKSVLFTLQLLYVQDFFANEKWYLKTIDMAHDHFGFYFCWGDLVWLPFMYTLQAQYLNFTGAYCDLCASIALLFGCFAYCLFRLVNDEKQNFRDADGECLIWGQRPKYINVKYKTLDGCEHKSKLLASGFWGLARHFNYVPDLILSFCYGLACGVDSIIPYLYFFYMCIVLVHRIERDHGKCLEKYGEGYVEYCRRVKYKLIPYVY